MPYKKVTQGDKIAVFKVDADGKPTGKALGTHDNDEDANAQLAALNIAEKKPAFGKKEATDDDHQKMYDEMPVEDFYPGPISFTELEKLHEAHEAGEKLNEMAYQFPQMVRRIFGREDVTDKDAALETLANEFISFAQEALNKEANKKSLWTRVKEAVGITPPDTTSPNLTDPPIVANEPTPEGLSIWQNKETGEYYWLAAYSNNYRDDDRPAEIISTQSHEEFDEALEKGEWPKPEVWLWHIPYPVGQTMHHAFDETTGFTIAAGSFDKGKEWVAEALIKAGWEGVSHGMPKILIERDSTDPTIITKHRTREISFLPAWAAANKLSFNIISKELEDMDDTKGLPAHKRPEFLAAFGEERVAEIEKQIAERATQAKEEGVEQKEQATYPGLDGLITAGNRPTTPEPFDNEVLVKALAPVAKAFEQVLNRLDAFDARLKEIEKDEGDRIAEKAANTPAASLEAQIEGLFSQANRVDGRTSLVKSGPKITQPQPKTGMFFEQWLQAGGNDASAN